MIRAPKILLLFAVLASAAPLNLSAWKFRKPIPVAASDGLAVVKLDRDVFIHADPQWQDLRVVRDGVEVPLQQEVLGQEEDHVSVPAKMMDLAVVDGPAVQFTLEVGRTQHNRVTIHTPAKNFRQQVRVEASENNQDWATLRPDASIFDFTEDTHQFSSLDVSFPASTKPYLRVTILGWDQVKNVSEASVDSVVKRSPVREVLATIQPAITEDSKNKSTIATLDLGVAGLPVDYLLLDVSTPQFHRAVNVEVSLDGKEWGNLVEGVIARLPGDGYTEERLALHIPASGSRYLRIRVFNRDDQPVEIRSVSLQALLHVVKFLPSAAGNYWLYYGNEDAKAPEYDLGILLSKTNHLIETSVKLGAEQSNPLYRAPVPPQKPWSEQHPAILYTALGVAVVGLGVATLRFALRMRT